MLDESSMLSIKQFSEMTGVSQSTLRYYDHIGLFTPAGRGVNNYRYYVPYQMIALNFVTVLSDLGVPLSKIKSLAKSRTPHDIVDLLMEREIALDKELKKLQAAYSLIHTFQHNIRAGENADANQITMSYKEEDPIVLGSPNNWEDKETFYDTFSYFCKLMAEDKNHLHYPIGGYFEDIDAFKQAPSHPTRYFMEDPNGKDSIAAGHYLIGYVHGYYGDMGDIVERINSYVSESRLKLTGPVYVIYLLNEVSLLERDQYLAQVSVRVSKKA